MRFFTELGEQANADIEDRYLEYAGPGIPGESAEDKQVRLIQAMNRASEEVFAEPVTPSPASQGVTGSCTGEIAYFAVASSPGKPRPDRQILFGG